MPNLLSVLERCPEKYHATYFGFMFWGNLTTVTTALLTCSKVHETETKPTGTNQN